MATSSIVGKIAAAGLFVCRSRFGNGLAGSCCCIVGGGSGVADLTGGGATGGTDCLSVASHHQTCSCGRTGASAASD